VRDTTKSPLTLGEILFGVYTLEVDWLTYETVAIILAASADDNIYSELVDAVATNLAPATITAIICAVLGVPTIPTITSIAVGTVVSLGWNYLRKIDRANMYDCWTTMNNMYMMEVKFMYANGWLNRICTRKYRTVWIYNPFPGTYGYWHKDKYGILYSY
jgi:hypothetical protein